MSKTETTPEKKRGSCLNRGGSWSFFPQHARSAVRLADAAQTQSSLLGFRLVEVIDEQD